MSDPDFTSAFFLGDWSDQAAVGSSSLSAAN
jgi:hypothetical protein